MIFMSDAHSCCSTSTDGFRSPSRLLFGHGDEMLGVFFAALSEMDFAMVNVFDSLDTSASHFSRQSRGLQNK